MDDDPGFERLVGRWLRDGGYQVVAARDGVAAFEAAMKRAPDVVLLDLGLPKEDGFSILKRLRANPRLRHLPVVIVSADPEPSHRVRAMRLGAFRFVDKWSVTQELFAVLAAVEREPTVRGVAL